MKKIDLYILKKLLLPFLLSIPVITFLAVLNEIRESVDELPMLTIGILDLLRIAILFLPPVLVFIIPLAFLMSVIWAIGDMYQKNELLSLQAAGISSKRIILAPILMGLTLSISVFIIQNSWQLWSVNRINHFIFTELPQSITLANLPANELNNFGDWKVVFESSDEDTVYNIDIIIEELDTRTVYSAQSATLQQKPDGNYLALTKGNFIRGEMLANFDTFELKAPSLIPKEEQEPSRHGLTLLQLFEQNRTLSIELEETSRGHASDQLVGIREEIANRLITPVVTLLFSVFGCAAAMLFSRRGKSRIFFVSLCTILTYFILTSIVPPSGLADLSEVILRMSIPSILLAITAAILYLNTDRIQKRL